MLVSGKPKYYRDARRKNQAQPLAPIHDKERPEPDVMNMVNMLLG